MIPSILGPVFSEGRRWIYQHHHSTVVPHTQTSKQASKQASIVSLPFYRARHLPLLLPLACALEIRSGSRVASADIQPPATPLACLPASDTPLTTIPRRLPTLPTYHVACLSYVSHYLAY